MKKRKKYKAKKPFSALPFLLIIFSFLFLYFLFFSDVFVLKKIKINTSIPETINIVERNIIKKNNNLFLFNTKKIKSDFSQITEIESFSIKRKIPNTLIIDIIEKESVLTCCFENNCFAIDKNGYAFKKTVKENYINCSLLILGEKVMDEKDVSNILFIKNRLDYLLGKLSFQNNNLILETKEGWNVFFDSKNNISDQIIRLEIVLEKMIENHSTIDYIDLRFGEKVYFK